MRRGLAWKLSVVGAVSSLVACTFTRDLDYLSDAPPVVTEEPDSGDAPPKKDAGVETKTDANADAGCAAGTVIRPVAKVDFQGPVVAGEAPQAVTCNPDNVLAEDGQTTNLDRTMNGNTGKSTLQGEDIAGCIGVRFEQDVQTVGVKLGPVGDGCPNQGQACDPDPTHPEHCGTDPGFQALLFAGPDEKTENLRFVRRLQYGAGGDTLRDAIFLQSDKHIALPGMRVIIVCRPGFVSAFRDDVAVDAIWAECN